MADNEQAWKTKFDLHGVENTGEQKGRSTVEVLRAARERISDPERWTRGRLSDNQRFFASYEDDVASVRAGTCWCAIGALLCEAPTWEEYQEAADLWIEVTKDGARFNDTHTHAEVLAAFDKAIEKAEAI